MKEERLFILKMLEEGKINASEAAALLEALDAGDRETAPDDPSRGDEARTAADGSAAGAAAGVAAGDRSEAAGEASPAVTSEEPAAQAGPGAGPDAGGAGDPQRPEDETTGTGATSGAGPHGDAAPGAGQAGGSGAGEDRGAKRRLDDEERSWSEFSRDLAHQIRETIQLAMRGVPQITEELKENFAEVREELEHTFKEVREELRKGPLVDVSGLKNLLNNVFGRGPSHEVTEEFTGSWSEGVEPRLECRTRNGSVTISGWDEPHYRVLVRKWVHAPSEEEAQKISVDAVHIVSSERGFEIACRDDHRVSVSIEAKVPRRFTYELHASSTNGAVGLDGIRVSGGRATTTNGAIRVRDVSGERLSVSTTNGRVSCEDVHVKELEASTTNGGVNWDGSALVAKLRTTNGGIRLAPNLPAAAHAGGNGHGEAVTGQYTAETTNAGIHVKLPVDPGLGVRFESRGRGIDLAVEDGQFVIGGQSKEFGSHFMAAATQGYDGASRRMALRLQTTNGSIRLESARPHRGDARDLHDDHD